MGPRARPWLPLLAAGLVALTPAFASPQVPAGAEFRVSQQPLYDVLSRPAMAAARDGRFVVAWASPDGSFDGIAARRFEASGTPVGAEFRVNTFTTGIQGRPAVAVDAAGGFLVVWQSDRQLGSGWDVLARRYDASGAPLGGEFQVNTYTTGAQMAPAVARQGSRAFVVVWTSTSQDGQGGGIFGQRYDASGLPRGDEFRANTYTSEQQDSPTVAAAASGDFVVAWRNDSQYSNSEIFGQRYDAAGSPRGAEFRVSLSESCLDPTAGMAASGGFVVAWTGLPGIVARRFDASGAPLGAELPVSTPGPASSQSLAVDDTGSFEAAWSLFGGAPSSFDVVARRFDASGTPRGPEFRVNTYTTDSQRYPGIATDGAGNFVVAWTSLVPGPTGVFAQRFGGLIPRGLSVDAIGNVVLEPGETARVAPSWQNLTGASQTVAGTLAALPDPDCIHSVVDGVADYGTVPDGATAVCTDCYVVSAAASTPRCRPHWDIRAVETLTPAAQGQAKLWVLHVGRSFTDVPTSNAFYRFIETAFHNGVTGGCGAGLFCPSGFMNREQIPVFILVGKDGTGYQPPACVPPNMFDDVPETSPFCRWIEELARRGVVGGCSANPPLYCPQGLFTREQLAVFILRLVDPDLDPPACVPPNMFDDVPETSPFCRWIEELARRGSAGCSTNPPLYCPHDPVTREQMTVFISVMFGLTLYGP